MSKYLSFDCLILYYKPELYNIHVLDIIEKKETKRKRKKKRSLTVEISIYKCSKVYYPRTGWLAVALLPTPIALFMLAASGGEVALYAGTALIGISSGFVFSAAVSITSELFGPNSAGVNHNILITNIPIGSLFYGLLAALVYDSNKGSSSSTTLEMSLLKEATICMGRKCYWQTFIWWGCFSILGLASSFLLFLRTRPAYDRFEMNRCRPQSSSEDQILLCRS